MDIQDIINTQYKVMVMMDELGLHNGSVAFKDFKERTLENLKYLSQLRDKDK